MNKVFMDWISIYFEAPQKGIICIGYSHDHRPDKHQVIVGLSIDGNSGMPVRMTVNPGKILDVTHFEDTFNQILPLYPRIR